MLRDQGWMCEIVEHWNPFVKRRKDLWGFCDILAIRPGETLAVQTTSTSNVSARVTKILAEPKSVAVLKAGIKIEVHGWKKAGPRGKRKTWQCMIKKIEL